MNVSRNDNSTTSTKLVIVADSTDLEPIKRHVLAHFRHSVRIPGFRAGTAPMALVEKNVNEQSLHSEFLDHALNELYRRSVQQENLRPVGEPNVQLKKFVPFSDIELEVETEIIGPLNIPDYKKIKVPKTAVSISVKDVNDVIIRLQEQQSTRKEIKRTAKSGDEIVIDYEGKDKDGKPVAGTDAKDYSLVLGSKSFIPGFEKNLIGLKAGEKKDFKIKFPPDYTVAAMQNKDVIFSVSVKKVNQLVIPKANDVFASKAGHFKSLAELKTDVRKQLKLEREKQTEQDYANRVIGEIVDRSKVEIPKSLIDEQIVKMEEEEKRNLAYRGQTWKEHLEEEKITDHQHRERQKPQAEQQIKGGLVLSEIAEREDISATQKEVDERIMLLKGQYQDEAMRAELDKPNARRDIESRILTEKTIDKIVGYSSK